MLGLFKKKNKRKEVPKTAYTHEIGAFKERPRLEYAVPWKWIEPNTGLVLNKDNSMFYVYSFRGPDMESSTQTELGQYCLRLNNAFMRLGTGFTIYLEAQRRISSSYDASLMPTPLLQQWEDDRRDYYESSAHYESEYYLILSHVPPATTRSKIQQYFISESTAQKDRDVDTRAFIKLVDNFLANCNLVTDLLSKFLGNIEKLSTEETLRYLHNLISDHDMPIRYNPDQYLCDYLSDCSLLCGREPRLGKKWFKVVAFRSFTPLTESGMLDALNNLNIEYRWSCRFICLSPQDAKEEIYNYQKRWGQHAKSLPTMVRESITQTPSADALDEDALMQRDDAAAALVELASGQVAYGYYTSVVIVMDEDKEQCDEKATRVMSVINGLGFTASIERDNSIDAWRGTHPGCDRCNVRRPIVSSLNFCHLAPATAIWPGDIKNECLKGPVLLYTDSNGYTPFRLSLHVGDLGHTMIVGPSGSGKSVLLNTLEAHFLKYPNSNVFIFDKAGSSRALTYAVGGHFYNLAAEGASDLSFQPLARIDDPDECKWAKDWILSYLTSKNMTITPVEDNYVWNALQSMQRFGKKQRTMSIFTEMVQSEDIREALRPLTRNGSYGGLFDNDIDFAGSGNWQVYEMETLMNTPGIVPSTLDYLFHSIERQIRNAKGPSIIVLDECWIFFDNPAFKAKLREYFKDMRKKNTSIIFATQNLSDIASKEDLMTTVMENCPNRIYLPNVNARNQQNMEMYRKFGCNDRQIEIISSITPKQDYYYSCEQKGNRIFSLALQPSELPFVTATGKSDQQAMNQMIAAGKMDRFVEEWYLYKGAEEECEKYKEYARRANS
ncbi:MAG: conjugal transfer protein TrbE [Megasphaera massiliensis]